MRSVLRAAYDEFRRRLADPVTVWIRGSSRSPVFHERVCGYVGHCLSKQRKAHARGHGPGRFVTRKQAEASGLKPCDRCGDPSFDGNPRGSDACFSKISAEGA